MKMWGFLLLLLCIGLIFVKIEPFSEPKINIQNDNQIETELNEDGRIPENTQKIEMTKDQIYRGDLLLVNSEYPLRHESVKSDIVNLSRQNEWVNGYGLLDQNIYVSEGIAQKFSEMVQDAATERVSHFMINSGYRDFDEQNVLYQEMGADYALPPGYSEHNLGLSLDVGSTLMKMDEAPEGKWLEENAWKYGFILRYPKDKSNVTGIQYEPWHIRYVGLPHSVIMEEKNFALEEYLDFLIEQKSVSTTINGEKYEISYYSVTKDTTVHVPSNLRWEISGNNIDGVIVTVFPETTRTNRKEVGMVE